mgnify:CR=1 FL=1
MKNDKLVMGAVGIVIGIIAVALVILGNPANMGFCIACFIRDTAGGLGLHRAEPVQYIRPEIKFDSLEALKSQISKDKEEVLNFLNSWAN